MNSYFRSKVEKAFDINAEDCRLSKRFVSWGVGKLLLTAGRQVEWTSFGCGFHSDTPIRPLNRWCCLALGLQNQTARFGHKISGFFGS